MSDRRASLAASAEVRRDGAGWETCRVLVRLDDISYMSAILEAHDNMFLVRTETKGLGFLRLWYPTAYRPHLDRILQEVQGDIPLDILGFEPGMAGLDEVYPG